jgi:hypothetical protein
LRALAFMKGLNFTRTEPASCHTRQISPSATPYAFDCCTPPLSGKQLSTDQGNVSPSGHTQLEAAIKIQENRTKIQGTPKGLERLAVWALKDTYDVNRIASKGVPDRVERVNEITVVTAPTATNPNLHAQRGVFTLHRPPAILPKSQVEPEPLERVAMRLQKEHDIHQHLVEFSSPVDK